MLEERNEQTFEFEKIDDELGKKLLKMDVYEIREELMRGRLTSV